MIFEYSQAKCRLVFSTLLVPVALESRKLPLHILNTHHVSWITLLLSLIYYTTLLTLLFILYGIPILSNHFLGLISFVYYYFFTSISLLPNISVSFPPSCLLPFITQAGVSRLLHRGKEGWEMGRGLGSNRREKVPFHNRFCVRGARPTNFGAEVAGARGV